MFGNNSGGGLFGQNQGQAEAQDPNKTKPAFSFGTSTSTGLFGQKTSGLGLGSTGASSATNSTSSAPTGGFSFGSSSNKSATDTAPPSTSTGAFGKPSGLSSGLFGNTTGSTSTFSFGQSNQPSQATPAAQTNQAAPATSNNLTGSGTTVPSNTASGSGTTTSGLFGLGSSSTKPAESIGTPVASGFSFGSSKAASSSTPAATTAGGLFGGASSKPVLSFGSSTTSAADKSKETGTTQPFSFGSTFGSNTKSDPPAGGSSATTGTTAAASDSKPAFSLAAPSQKDTGKEGESPAPKLLFGTTPTAIDSGKPTLSAQPETKPAGGLSFGGASITPQSADPKTTSGSATANKEETAKVPAFTLGSSTTENKEDQSKASTKPSGSFSFGTTNTASTKTEKPADVTAAESSAKIEPSQYLKNKSFEDIVARWTTALTRDVAEFKRQAEATAKWDRILIENGDKISEIYNDVAAAEQSQLRIDDMLAYIGRQQDDVESMLDQCERQLSAGGAGPVSMENLQPVDLERKEAYGLAEQLVTRLTSLETNLTSVINEINKVTKQASHVRDEDPVAQIVKVLNAHLASLEYIDEASLSLQKKLADAFAHSSRVQL